MFEDINQRVNRNCWDEGSLRTTVDEISFIFSCTDFAAVLRLIQCLRSCFDYRYGVVSCCPNAREEVSSSFYVFGKKRVDMSQGCDDAAERRSISSQAQRKGAGS